MHRLLSKPLITRQQPRYKMVGKSKVANKMLRHFPLGPRLQQMYSTLAQAKLMVWHLNNQSVGGLV